MRNLLRILLVIQCVYVPFALKSQSVWQFKEKEVIPISDRNASKVSAVETNTTGSCPANIDFENGSFTNWKCYTGYAGGSTWTLTSPVTNRHQLVTKSSYPTNDPYGSFPRLCPYGGQYSLQLGNSQTGGEAEKVSYTYTIPANQNNFMITYYYAVVFEDPGHSFSEQPRFKAQVYDVSNGSAVISCASCDYTAGSGLPGFKNSMYGYDVLYKPWTPVTINLSGYAGHTITLEFTTQDCTLGGHFGYAYIDVSSDCSTLISGASYCSDATSLALSAPSSYQTYTWWDQTYKTKLGTGQTLTLTPPPANNTTINVDLVPYSGFGCRDTATTVISVNPSPTAAFTTNTSLVSLGKSIQFTNQSTVGGSAILNYKWDFGDGTTSTAANVTKTYINAGVYNVKLLVTTNNGCQDSINHSVKATPLSALQGPMTLCQGTTVTLIDSVGGGVWKSSSPSVATVDAKGVVSGVAGGKTTIWYVLSTTGFTDSVSTVITVRPTSSSVTQQSLCASDMPIVWNGMTINSTGSYVAHLTNTVGCDSVATLNLAVHPLKTTTLSDTIVQNQSYSKYGYSIPLQTKYGNFTFYQHQKTTFGCDSTVILNLKVSPEFSAAMRVSPRICADDKDFTLNYDIAYGNIELHTIAFDSKAQNAGFADIAKQTANGSYIDVPLPTNVMPDTYTASVVFDNGPITKTLPVTFVVDYPSSVIVQKWNNVLALLNSSNNGGFQFTDYQWYKNGQAIDGATKSYLYLSENKLDTLSEYSVKLTRANDGAVLFTCPLIPTKHTDINIYPTVLSKAMHVTVKIEGTGKALLLNVSGLKIKEQLLNGGENSMAVPDIPGTYLLLVTNDQGQSKKQLLIVK